VRSQVGASLFGAPDKKPYRMSQGLRLIGLQVRCLALGLGAAARQPATPTAGEQRVQFTARSRELHVVSRDLGIVEHVNPNGNLRIRINSGR
jgi:hypothetical protein